ncbi:MAG: acetyl-CoA carboxylase carboxyltransferase subunit alpha [Candidatus Saganbacteria bacterium]|nr:acetyl-CoA carboxylase carboxyltransferase subunit alpha [Candidatus Saganbacteria bacterium]
METKHLLPFEKPVADLYKKIEELKKLAKGGDIDMSKETRVMEERINNLRRDIFSSLTPNQIVAVARHLQRPTTQDYLGLIFDDFTELHGDRNFADDKAIIGGFAKFNGDLVMAIGHQKGKSTKDNIARCFGMAHPEGYRKALRLMRLADRFNRPIITFVDTPGAYPGIDAEERGQAEAIAKNLREMIRLKVPIIVVITGEGGSGGALGIGIGNKVLMLEYSIYSVISPEGCASILFRDSKRSAEAADNMKITSKDLYKLGVIDEIIKEPLGGAHNDYQAAADNIKASLRKHLAELLKLSPADILNDRYQKFRQMGEFLE